MSLRRRIAAVASASVALAVIAAAVGIYLGVRAELRGQVERSLQGKAEAILAGARSGEMGGMPPGGGSQGFPDRMPPAPFGGATGYVQFVQRDGDTFVPGGQGSARTIAPTAADSRIAASGYGSSLSDRTVDGTDLMVLTRGAGSLGAVMVARPLTEVNRVMGSLLWLLVFVGIGGIALAGGLGLVIARTALTPIARFTRRAETLSGGLDLTQRLDVEGDDELSRLARSFNVTMDALERSVQAQRHLIADAGHELRTPIASLRANIEVLQEAERLSVEDREALRKDVIEELDELTALVGDVVELARGQRRDGPGGDVRLDEVVADALRRSERRAGDVRFEASLEPAIVRGDASQIARAVSNLLENARVWSGQGGVVEVGLKDGTLSVRDHGPGFEDEDLPFVFDRFYRASKARGMPGSGLGLAIVRQAAEAHGGRVAAGNAPGGGALLEVSFGPAIEPAATVGDAPPREAPRREPAPREPSPREPSPREPPSGEPPPGGASGGGG